jgi:hypothetical protein
MGLAGPNAMVSSWQRDLTSLSPGGSRTQWLTTIFYLQTVKTTLPGRSNIYNTNNNIFNINNNIRLTHV